jgi:hypothetical protein
MRRVSTSFVVFACWVFCLLAPVGAQESRTPAEDQYAPGPDAECPGAKVVRTLTGTGDQQSAPFRITGDRFRLTVTNDPTPGDPSLAGVSVYVVDARSGDDVTRFAKEGAGQETSVINQGPGSFYLDTITANVSYTVAVEDCAGTPPGGPGGPLGPVDNPGGVMPGTRVRQVPFTGGPPIVVGALVLLGTALIAGRGVLRR